MANSGVFGNGRTHGLIDPGVEELANRRSAALHMLNCLNDGFESHEGAVLREATLLWRDVMNEVMRQTTPDWFLTSALLGHPTPQQCRRESTDIGTLSEAAELNDLFAVAYALKTVRAGQFPFRLVRFLELTRPGNETAYKMESDWLYLLSAREEWGVVNLGTIEGHVEQAVAEMDDLNPEIAPYGVAGAWRVNDALRGYDIASLVLKKAYIQNDFYEFHRVEDLDAMRTAIARALSDRHQLVETVGGALAYWGGVTSSGERNDGSLFDAEEDELGVGLKP